MGLNKPHHFFFLFCPIGNNRMERAERRRSPVSFRKSTAWRIFKSKNVPISQLSRISINISGHRRLLVTHANAHGTHASAETMVDVFVLPDSPSGNEATVHARETGAIDDAESLARTPTADGHTCEISNARASRTLRFTS